MTMNTSKLNNLKTLLINILDGCTPCDMAQRYGDLSNQSFLNKCEVIYNDLFVSDTQTDEQLLNAADLVIDGNTAHDLEGWCGLSSDDIQLGLDEYYSK